MACQASLAMEFSRQECWSRSSFPSPGDLPDPRTEPESLALQADADALLPEPPGKSRLESGKMGKGTDFNYKTSKV